MTKLSNGLRGAIMVSIAALAAGAPAIAGQATGDDISICMLKSKGTVHLGRFATMAEAATAARGKMPAPGAYAVANLVERGGGTKAKRKVAFDSAGTAHAVTEGICVGSGRKMRDPD